MVRVSTVLDRVPISAMVASSRRRFFVTAMVFLVVLFLFPYLSAGFGPHRFHRPTNSGSSESNEVRSSSFSRRKLLDQGKGAAATNRMGEGCSKDDIVVNQGATAPLPNGIPTYTVEVVNLCSSGCAIFDIHFSCGWFSSSQLVNPRVFRRLGYNDCLVNDGGAFRAGNSLSFQYANSFPYPLSVSSATCS